MDHHDVHLDDQRHQPPRELVLLDRVGHVVVAVLEGLRRAALVGIVVAGDAQPFDRVDEALVGRPVLPHPAGAGEDDRAFPRERAGEVVESWLPVTHTNGLPLRAARRTRLVSSWLPRSARAPTKNTGPPL